MRLLNEESAGNTCISITLHLVLAVISSSVNPPNDAFFILAMTSPDSYIMLPSLCNLNNGNSTSSETCDNLISII